MAAALGSRTPRCWRGGADATGPAPVRRSSMAALLTNVDMKTGNLAFGTPEGALLVGAQLAWRYRSGPIVPAAR